MNPSPLPSSRPRNHLATRLGRLANASAGPYVFAAETTTGHCAVRAAGGDVEIVPGTALCEFPPAPSVTFWSCRSATDARPAGNVASVNCADCRLSELDVDGLVRLRWLDCRGNALTRLAFAPGQRLDEVWCEGNPLRLAEVIGRGRIRFLDLRDLSRTDSATELLNGCGRPALA